MGSKAKPGEFDCYSAAEEDEPIFVLLGRDEDAPELVEDWCRKRLAHLLASDLTPERLRRGVRKIAEALTCAGAMREWRNNKQTEQGPLLPLPTRDIFTAPDEHYCGTTLADCVSKVEQTFSGEPSPLVERMRSEHHDRPIFAGTPIFGGTPNFGVHNGSHERKHQEPHLVSECGWRGCGGARTGRLDPEGGIPGRSSGESNNCDQQEGA